MTYLYFFSNSSLTLRLVEYLSNHPYWPLETMTVVHQIDGWIIQVKFRYPLSLAEEGDFRAFLQELGGPVKPSSRLQRALQSLEIGYSPVEVMRFHQVAIVSHGRPDCKEIQEFRRQFVKGLGYCPETLA